jgi:hypothetical protein
MKRVSRLSGLIASLLVSAPVMLAQAAPPAAENPPPLAGRRSAMAAEATDLLERFVNWLHGLWIFPSIDGRSSTGSPAAS